MALKSTGAMRLPRGPQNPWGDDEILEALGRHSRLLGRSPRLKDWILAGEDHPAGQTVQRRFGSWSRALGLAGLQPRKGGRVPYWTKSRIVVALQEESVKRGHAPTSTDWAKSAPAHPSASHVRRTFGSFADARRAAGVELPPTDPSVNEVAEAIRGFVAEHGVVPNRTEWSRNEMRPGASQILRVCGSWRAALILAGAEGRLERRCASREVWSKGRIVLALTLARAVERPGSKKRWKRSNDDHPNEGTVRATFGNWTKANLAAGFSGRDLECPLGLLDPW